MEYIHPEGFPTPGVPLSYGVRAGDLLFVSGQTATDAAGEVYVGDFAEEVTRTLDNVQRILEAAGAGFADVVKVGAYLTNASLAPVFNRLYAERVGDRPPARTTVVTGFAHANVRVEVDAIAWLGDSAQ